MQATGWTWDQLLDTPAEVVDEMLIRLSEESKEKARQQKEQKKKQGKGKK